jgi:hypothetical protein
MGDDRNRMATRRQGELSRWWRERTVLEKVGVGALAIAGTVIAAVVVFPGAAATAGGGALAASGAYLIKKGLGK